MKKLIFATILIFALTINAFAERVALNAENLKSINDMVEAYKTKYESSKHVIDFGDSEASDYSILLHNYRHAHPKRNYSDSNASKVGQAAAEKLYIAIIKSAHINRIKRDEYKLRFLQMMLEIGYLVEFAIWDIDSWDAEDYGKPHYFEITLKDLK